jgi:hypothetical protein
MKTYFILLILLFMQSGFAQTFETNRNPKNYACFIKINADSSVVFVIQENNYAFYQESLGRIKHLSDSTYLISSAAVFSQGIMENDYDPVSQFRVFIDSSFTNYSEIDTLLVKYYDGKDTTLKTQKGQFIKYSLDKSRFNKKHPAIWVYTKRKNPFNKKQVAIMLGLGSAIDFAAPYAEQFTVIISKNELKTKGDAPLQCGPFVLIKTGY